MSHKQKLEELKLQLERWKSHNEVHGKPADEILYNFLKSLLKSATDDEAPRLEPNPEETPDAPPVPPIEPEALGDDPPGGNNPPPPNVPE